MLHVLELRSIYFILQASSEMAIGLGLMLA